MKLNIYILPGAIFLLLTWLFVGLFRDDEFNDPYLFTKHRPTLKVNFHSPIGMSDLKLDDLSPEKQTEELAFEEFVINQQLQNNSNARLWYVPYILIQLTLTFLTFGIVKSREPSGYRMWQPLVHFSICVTLTPIGLVFILAFDRLFITVLLGLVIVTINYLVWGSLTGQWRKT